MGRFICPEVIKEKEKPDDKVFLSPFCIERLTTWLLYIYHLVKAHLLF